MRHPTILDVANEVGMSKSLVSLVMRGSDGVSPTSRKAVLEAAANLGYRPNAAAQTMVRQRSYAIGVMVSDLHNPFFADVIDGVDMAVTEAGYRAIMTTGNRVPGAGTSRGCDFARDAGGWPGPRFARRRQGACHRGITSCADGHRWKGDKGRQRSTASPMTTAVAVRWSWIIWSNSGIGVLPILTVVWVLAPGPAELAMHVRCDGTG